MKNETRKWLDYAAENLKSAKILMDSGLYNPSLHLEICRMCIEIAQRVEKSAIKIING